MTGTNYVSISRRALDLEDYIDIARRHIGWIIGPAFAGLVIAVVVANFLQNTYISRAVMQITPATISESLVQSVSTSMLNERVSQMQNEILSRTSLSQIIQDPRLQLYKDDLARKPLEDIIEQMRQDIRIELTMAPSGGGRRASAFTVQFSYKDKYKARDTVQTFVTRFIDANQTSQRTTSVTVKSFVDGELAQAKANLDQLDEQLTKFRISNTGKLPEEFQYNNTNLVALQGQANQLSESMNRSEQAKLQVEAATSASKTQLATWDTLSQDTDISSPVAQKNEELMALSRQVKDLDTRIDLLRQNFDDKYPDLKEALKTREVFAKKRDTLQKEQDAAEAAPKTERKTPRRTSPQTSSYLADIRANMTKYDAQLEGIRLQKVRDQKLLDTVNGEINQYRRRIADTPGIDLNYKALERAEKNAQDKFQEYLKKQQLAGQNEAMVQAKAAENLEVLDPPSLPEQPSAPKRPFIIGAGFAGAIVLGFGMAAIREMKDSSLKNLKDVRAYTNLPVLSSIPLLENALLVRRKRRITYLAWSAAVIVGVLMVSVSLYYRYTIAT